MPLNYSVYEAEEQQLGPRCFLHYMMEFAPSTPPNPPPLLEKNFDTTAFTQLLPLSFTLNRVNTFSLVLDS